MELTHRRGAGGVPVSRAGPAQGGGAGGVPACAEPPPGGAASCAATARAAGIAGAGAAS